MTLVVKPDIIVFTGPDSSQTIELSNSGDQPLLFKVKGPDNKKFIFKPPIGIVEAGGQASVDVIRSEFEFDGENKEENVAVFMASCAEPLLGAQKCWEAKPDQTKAGLLPVTYAPPPPAADGE